MLHSLFKVEVRGKVLQEHVHVTGDSEGEEGDDVHQPLPQGGVGLDKRALDVLEEDLELVVSLHLHGREEALEITPQGGR